MLDHEIAYNAPAVGENGLEHTTVCTLRSDVLHHIELRRRICLTAVAITVPQVRTLKLVSGDDQQNRFQVCFSRLL